MPPTYHHLSRGSLTHCLSSELYHIWLFIPARKRTSDTDPEVLVLYQVAWRKTFTPKLETGPCPSLKNSLNDVSHCRLHLFWRKSSMSLFWEKTSDPQGQSYSEFKISYSRHASSFNLQTQPKKIKEQRILPRPPPLPPHPHQSHCCRSEILLFVWKWPIKKKKRKAALGGSRDPTSSQSRRLLIRAQCGASEICAGFSLQRQKKAGGWISKHGLAPGGLARIPELGLRMPSSTLSLL